MELHVHAVLNVNTFKNAVASQKVFVDIFYEFENSTCAEVT